MEEAYQYMRQKAYFVRVFLRENNAPVYIKIPESIATPGRSIKLLNEAFYDLLGVECLVVVRYVKKTENGPRPAGFGPRTDEVMLVITPLETGNYVSGIITPNGEFEILCLEENGDMVIPVVDEAMVRALGLEYVDDITEQHRAWMLSTGYSDADDSVYCPNFLFD